MKEKVSTVSLSRSSSRNSIAEVREEMLKILLPMLFKEDGSWIMTAISHQPPQSPLMKTPTHPITMQYSASALINQSTPVENGDVLRIKPLTIQYGCMKTLEYGSTSEYESMEELSDDGE
ncbi:hypothetical protein L3X38_024001 [Prunus dulcis]|uniref:Uncharacterized protein n=1 Tax=Prunus dulcis TaxID=3755 RepID=A0AAD4VYX6_PRUDU|nr:hypothetical protein L3X38_024001 [Prunus dulcis]